MAAIKKIKELFDAEASSPSEAALLHNGSVGFRVPEYQRQYDWSSDNIHRLFCDCLGGFHRLSTSPNADAFTFLGTLILVEEKKREADFGGTSVAIVDGQQRLTTLTLLACALYENLNIDAGKLAALKLKASTENWIRVELDDRMAELLECAVGTQKIKGNKTYPFPRIIRTEDHRGRSSHTSEYRSPLGKLLKAFAEYAANDEDEFLIPSIGNGTDSIKLAENYKLIRDLLIGLNDTEWYEDKECDQVTIDHLNHAGYRSLLDRLADMISSQDDQDIAIAELRKCIPAHDLVRTLLFAAYFCRCVVLTRVMTDDENAAFDIFDALNTTGEPLTAIETLKPRVIQFESSNGTFGGSPSDCAFQRIRQCLDEQYKDTSRKQKETKELIVTFALFVEGRKLPEHLAAQRNFLRTRFDKSSNSSHQHGQRFVSLLADVAEFRRFYWTQSGIEELGLFHDAYTVGQVQLLMTFIRDMQTKLALPIINRYWAPDLKKRGDTEFVEVLKAVTAFLVIRRAASGGTAGIDSDLRAVMATKNGSSKKFGLCAGVDGENQKLSASELKAALRKLLAESKFKISKKDKWVDQVVDNPLYQQAKVLVRFMLLTAAHHSLPSTKSPGCWEKAGVKSSSHINNFLTYDTWISETYETVEHIAPESEPKLGWDTDIYKNMILRHSIGNLVLLPRKENGAIGNDSWKKKKIFYLALTEETADKQQERIDQATAQGIKFSNFTTDLLQSGENLSLLAPLRNVEDWNRKLIEARARNTAGLTWDVLWPWLN